jgi:hypothetical protein
VISRCPVCGGELDGDPACRCRRRRITTAEELIGSIPDVVGPTAECVGCGTRIGPFHAVDPGVTFMAQCCCGSILEVWPSDC